MAFGRDMCGFWENSGYIHFVVPQCMMHTIISLMHTVFRQAACLRGGAYRLAHRGVVSHEVSC